MASPIHPRRRAPDSTHGSLLCLKGNMTLSKSATFHSPTSPVSSSLPSPPLSPSSSDDHFIPPRLVRRSQTNLDDVVDAHRRRAALIIDEFDKSLCNTDSLSELLEKSTLRDPSLPVPRSFIDSSTRSMGSADSEGRTLRPRPLGRASKHQHASDSGLGTSIASSREKRATSTKKDSRAAIGASAITRSAASTTMENVPGLSPRAVNRIYEHTLRPLRAKPSLKEFEPIIEDIPRRINTKEIICLRDLEKTLVYMAPEMTKAATKYLDFCLTSLRCLQVTVEYISDRDQIRPNDRPYTNGYFMDLEQQIYQYARELAAAKEGKSTDIKVESDMDEIDEVRLFGGMAKNGKPAELVRVRKDGKAISLATGEDVDLDEDEVSSLRLKRSLSEQAEDEEEIMRSMARRKKNAPPEELAPKPCREPGCNKLFKRACDLTKHEKTHKRPWKCPVDSCKYHDLGWPTEKELERHRNDKHTDNPHMYSCWYPPCPYKSKRESNCKQHMEKAHNWTYNRQKTNGKKGKDQYSSAAPTTLSPATIPEYSVPTPPQETTPAFMPDGDLIFRDDGPELDFALHDGSYPSTLEFDMDMLSPHNNMTSYEQTRFPRGEDFIVRDEIYAPVQLPTPDPTIFIGKTQQMPLPDYTMNNMNGQMQVAPAHFSPGAESDAMLYTPTSMADFDDQFDDSCNGAKMGGDFQLFPGGVKASDADLMMADVPSAAMLSFSQPASQDMFPAMMDHPQMDWPNIPDYSRYRNN